MIAAAHALDLLTTPYVFTPDEARAMTRAGADIIVAHMGVTTGGAIGATSAKTLDACVAEIDAIADAARADPRRRHRPLPRRPDRRARRRRLHPEARPHLPRLLRRLLHGAPAGRAGPHRTDPRLQGHLGDRHARQVRHPRRRRPGGPRLGPAPLALQPARHRRAATSPSSTSPSPPARATTSTSTPTRRR